VSTQSKNEMCLVISVIRFGSIRRLELKEATRNLIIALTLFVA